MSKKPTVEIAIPIYNEEKELVGNIVTLRRFLQRHLAGFSWKIVIADNASTDKSWELARKLAESYPEVTAIHLPEKGRGRAVKKVWGKSKSEIIAYMDVDLSTDLRHLPSLVRSLERGYDLAIGSRNAKAAAVYGRNPIRTITSKAYITLIKLFFLVHFSDAQCGFKAIRREVAHRLLPWVRDNEWFFDTELLVIAEKAGYRIYEEPVTWIDNPGSTVRVLKTAFGDLRGLWRLFWTRPWKKFYGKF